MKRLIFRTACWAFYVLFFGWLMIEFAKGDMFWPASLCSFLFCWALIELPLSFVETVSHYNRVEKSHF